MKAYPTRIEISDDCDTLVAVVETFDEAAATITLHDQVYNSHSLEELITALRAAFKALDLDA